MGLLSKLEDKSKKKIVRPISKSSPKPSVLEDTKTEEIDMAKIKADVEARLKSRTLKQQKVITKEIEKQRIPIKKVVETSKAKHKRLISREWVKTGVPGFDELFEKGIPKGTSILIAGGAGSGKTILALQILNHATMNNEKGLYISLEESEFRLKKHMHNFNWEPEILEKKGLLKIKRIDPFKIARSVEALLAEATGELKMDIREIGGLIPEDFEPQWIIIDSLTALAAAFKKDEEANYRVYIEQLFRYFEKLGVTSFLISETEQMPTKFSKTGVEEFLADGVIVLYNIKHGNVRETAIEVLKLRGAKHQKKIVAMQILSDKGIVVYPEQEVFSEIGGEK